MHSLIIIIMKMYSQSMFIKYISVNYILMLYNTEITCILIPCRPVQFKSNCLHSSFLIDGIILSIFNSNHILSSVQALTLVITPNTIFKNFFLKNANADKTIFIVALSQSFVLMQKKPQKTPSVGFFEQIKWVR